MILTGYLGFVWKIKFINYSIENFLTDWGIRLAVSYVVCNKLCRLRCGQEKSGGKGSQQKTAAQGVGLCFHLVSLVP